MNNNFIKSFVWFFDKWGLFVSFLWSAFIQLGLDTYFGIKIHENLRWTMFWLQFAIIIRYFYLFLKRINKELDQKKQPETLVLNLVGYIKICDRKEVNFYYRHLIRMVVNNDINICYDGQMDYTFFTSKIELFIAVYDSKEDCLFINSGYKKMIDDNKTEG